jgi:molecular chaperone GrpE
MANNEGTKREEVQIEEKESQPSEPEEIEALEPHEKELLKELENTKKQLGEEKDRFLRLNAEFDNFRKRTIKEKEELIKYANEKLILELIDVCESLERGLENAKKTDNGNKDKLIEGLELIYTQFKNVLEKNGLVPIKAQGEKFDPYKHEAMMQTLTDEYDDGAILEEFARGYMLNNRVIRYSKVRVSKKKEEVNNEVK